MIHATLVRKGRNPPENTGKRTDIENLAAHQGHHLDAVPHKTSHIFADALIGVVKLALHLQIKVSPIGFKPKNTNQLTTLLHNLTCLDPFDNTLSCLQRKNEVGSDRNWISQSKQNSQ